MDVQTSNRKREAHDLGLERGAVLSGRYVLEKKVGQGGMGRVFAARDRFSGTRVAVKAPRWCRLEDGGSSHAYEREYSLASVVTHPNVVQVRTYDVDGPRGLPYLVMELVDGPSLHSVLADTCSMDLDQVLVAARQLADALRAVHKANIIHRDLKPGNVVLAGGLTKPTRAVLVDFGVAEAPWISPPPEDMGALVGTPAYMSPEQVWGLPTDARTDLYALGRILQEMLFGPETPVERSCPRWMPKPLNALLESLLHPDPNLRPASAAAVSEMLNEL